MTLNVNATKPSTITVWQKDENDHTQGFVLQLGSERVELTDKEAAKLGRYLVFEDAD